MSAASATVEVLTAEVRVLMVGSRQVTLSVYNQLDWYRADSIEPFGRVHPKNDYNGEYIFIVGRDRLGNLVRSRCFKNQITRDEEALQWRAEAMNAAAAGEPLDDQQQTFLRALRWANLPLIVLAGLR